MDCEKMSFEELWEYIENNAIKNEDIRSEVKLYLSLEMRGKGYMVALSQVYERKNEFFTHIYTIYETDSYDKKEALVKMANAILNDK
jgi:hypothetical protein